MKPSLAYPCQTLCLTIHIENSEICVAVTNRICRGFELRSTCDHYTIRWLPVVVLWGINLSNVNFPEKLCGCDVGTEFSIIALIAITLYANQMSLINDLCGRGLLRDCEKIADLRFQLECSDSDVTKLHKNWHYHSELVKCEMASNISTRNCSNIVCKIVILLLFRWK